MLLAIAWIVFANAPTAMVEAVFALLRGNPAPAPPIGWYGTAWPRPLLGGAFILLLLGGAVLAAYRLMRVALLYRSLPWAYAGVTAAGLAFLAGFAGALDLVLPRAGIAFTGAAGIAASAALAVYPALMFGRKDIVYLARLIAACHMGRWRDALEMAPPWLAALLLAGALVVAASLTGATDAILSLLALLAFVLRDIAIAFWWQLRPTARRADLATFLTLVILYGALPALLLAAGLRPLLSFLLPVPVPGLGAGPGAAIAAAEAVVVWALVYRRWRVLRPAVSPG